MAKRGVRNVSTNDLPALSRCPFCNGDAEFSETGHPLDNDYFTVVGCTECSALVTNGWGDTPEEARRAAAGEWNRRHERMARIECSGRDVHVAWTRTYRCGGCGSVFELDVSPEHARFCPNCGARVTGGDE